MKTLTEAYEKKILITQYGPKCGKKLKNKIIIIHNPFGTGDIKIEFMDSDQNLESFKSVNVLEV